MPNTPESRTEWTSDESAFVAISDAIGRIAKACKEHPKWGVVRIDTPELMAYFHIDRLGVYELKDGEFTLIRGL